MERYFKVTNSVVGREYMKHKENSRLVNELYKKFKEENGIEAKDYCPRNTWLGIVPTENDKEKFKTSLCKKEYSNGLISFKKNSKINKSWVNKLIENNIEITNSSDIIFLSFYILGRYSSRLFDVDKEIYLSLDGDEYYIKNLKLLDGMIEMKASEFFKIIEDCNDSLKEEDV